MVKIKKSHSSKVEKTSDNGCRQADESNGNLFLDNDNDEDDEDDESEPAHSDEESKSSEQPKTVKRTLDDDGANEARKKKMKREKNLFAQPTVEELNRLRETENLFHSNLFRLQIEEVLDAVKVKDKYRKLFADWLSKFKKNIQSIEETEEISLASAEASECLGVKVPQPSVPVDAKGVFKFLKPSDIGVIGSYALGSVTGPDIAIDVMIEMPSKLFQKLDYKNYRYTRKRALYLAHIASNLDERLVESKKFTGEIWMPNLMIVPRGKLGKRVTVHVHLAAQEGSLKLNRFLPGKNSVRPDWYFGEEKVSEDDKSLIPTPHYNSTVLRDLTMSRVNSHNSKIIAEYPNLRDGLILLKIWLRQRQFNDTYDSFNSHVLTTYVVYLLHEKKLNTFMSSYQIVRNVWNCLAQSDWTKNGLTMCPDDDSKARAIDYKNYYDCVFLDISGYHNLVAHVSADTYNWIRSEAERTVGCLDNPNLDSFQALFMRPVPFYRTFDHFVRLNDRCALENMVEDKSSPSDKLDYGVNKRAQAIKMICGVLKEGLGNRVSNMYVRPEKRKIWDVTDDAPDGMDATVIGLSLDPQFCFNIIDKGPHANLDVAAAFRKFWGNKSELRRFQDGAICEAVVWTKGKTLAEKRTVCNKIVRYLLKEKFDLSKDQHEYVADEMDDFLRMKKVNVVKFAYGTGEEATLQVLKVFDALEKELKSLTDLPLTISGVEGFSPVFRYTDVFPPLATSHRPIDGVTKEGKNYLLLNKPFPKKTPRYVPHIEASVQLAISGKWPDELEAVRKTKAAFHIQIAECLRKQFQLKAQGNSGCVDVYKEGFAFRLEVRHEREIALLKREVSEDHVERYRDNEESVRLENRLFHMPKLSSALHGLHSQQPSFGPSCCLAKRWLSAHMLDDSHIPDIVVELLVASMFLTPDPYKPAQSPQVAFFRLLEFFARNHCSTEPLFVNFNNEMTREDMVAIENSFRAAGDSNPPLLIATPYDPDGSMWTRKAPSRLILNRISSLAREALKLVDGQLEADSTLTFGALFVAPTSEYDYLIRLESSHNPTRPLFHDLPDKYPTVTLYPYKAHSKQKIPVVGFDPVQCYLRELRRAYDEFALFFHDTYGGSVIGVLLKPAALEMKEFKVSNINGRRLNDDGKLVLNVAAMLDDFSILGRGLVKSIDVQSKPTGSN